MFNNLTTGKQAFAITFLIAAIAATTVGIALLAGVEVAALVVFVITPVAAAVLIATWLWCSINGTSVTAHCPETAEETEESKPDGETAGYDLSKVRSYVAMAPQPSVRRQASSRP